MSLYEEFTKLMGKRYNGDYEYYKTYIEIDYIDSEYTNMLDYVEHLKEEVENGRWVVRLECLKRIINEREKFLTIIEEQEEQLDLFRKEYAELRNKYRQIENIVKGV